MKEEHEKRIRDWKERFDETDFYHVNFGDTLEEIKQFISQELETAKQEERERILEWAKKNEKEIMSYQESHVVSEKEGYNIALENLKKFINLTQHKK